MLSQTPVFDPTRVSQRSVDAHCPSEFHFPSTHVSCTRWSWPAQAKTPLGAHGSPMAPTLVRSGVPPVPRLPPLSGAPPLAELPPVMAPPTAVVSSTYAPGCSLPSIRLHPNALPNTRPHQGFGLPMLSAWVRCEPGGLRFKCSHIWVPS